MTPEPDVEARITRILVEGIGVDAPAPAVDLIDSGVIDSLTFVELLYHLEQEFEIKISLEEIDVDDLRTVAAIGSAVRRLAPVG